MAKNALSHKALEIAVKNRNNFGKAKAQFQELLRPKNSEMSIKKVKWQVSKSDW
jgi:hypothetical protein